MIQRIQSVYLLLGAVALGAMFFFGGVLWRSAPAEAYPWFTPALVVLVALAAVAGLGAIFLFADRPRQRAVVVAAQTLTVLAVLVLLGGFFLADALVVTRADGTLVTSRLIAFLLPVVAYVFFFLARRGIESDMALVRSMDRLR